MFDLKYSLINNDELLRTVYNQISLRKFKKILRWLDILLTQNILFMIKTFSKFFQRKAANSKLKNLDLIIITFFYTELLNFDFIKVNYCFLIKHKLTVLSIEWFLI